MKVALVGTANCGKSTLINALDDKRVFKNHGTITDVAGKYFTKAERKFLPTQRLILDKQIIEEAKLQNFISDRSVIDNQAYFMYHYKKLEVKTYYNGLFGDYFKTFDNHMRQHPYDALIFIDDYFEIEDNGMREVDTDMQEWIFGWLSTQVPMWCDIYDVPLYTVSGATVERIKEVKRVLKKHYSQRKVSDYV